MNTPTNDDSPPRPGLIAWLQLVRAPNLFTAMADVLMGFLVTHPRVGSNHALTLALLLAASTALYASGTVLNDVFDFELDSRQRPNRPLPSGRIDRSVARLAGWKLLLAGMILGWLASLASPGYDLRPGVVVVLLAGCVVLYDGLLKRTPLAPLAMGGCRALNVLLGMSLAPNPWNASHMLTAAALGLYIVGVTWFARTEARRSSRARLTAAILVALSGVGLLGALPRLLGPVEEWAVEPAGLLVRLPDRWPLLLGALGALVGYRMFLAVLEPVPYRVQMAVRQCILSLVILDAAVVLGVRGLAPAIAVLLLLAPVLMLGRWIDST